MRTRSGGYRFAIVGKPLLFLWVGAHRFYLRRFNEDCDEDGWLKPFSYGVLSMALYEISAAKETRSRVQNAIAKNVFDALEESDIVALEAPTGFGKTFLALGLAKNFVLEKKKRVLIATAATNHTVNFWKDHLKQEGLNPSNVDLGFLIGKGNPTYKPCVFLSDEPGSEIDGQESIYSLCDRAKESGDCVHYENVFGEQKAGQKTLKPSGEAAVKELHSKLSDPHLDLGENDLVQIIGNLKEKQLCPYYLFKKNFSSAKIQVCDYQYLINPKYLEEDTSEFLLVIDEFDKFEERLREQFKISLSQSQLTHVLSDLRPTNRDLFLRDFEKMEINKRRELAYELELYAESLKTFLDHASKGLPMDVPKGIEVEKAFFGVPLYRLAFERFNQVFKANESDFFKLISDSAKKHDPYRHVLAFHFRLAFSVDQKNAITFVDSVSKRKRGDQTDVFFVRRPLVFTEFFQSLARRFEKIVVMSATLPFQEMLEIQFGEKVDWFTVPKNAGLTGQKQGIILKHPALDFSSRKRFADIGLKAQMIGDLILELSEVKREIVVFFNAYGAFNPVKDPLFSLLEKNGVTIFLDEEKKLDASHSRDEQWEKFKQSSGKKVMFSTMYTKYARGSNMLKDNGCRILLLIGIPYPQVYDFEIKKFDELAKKHKWKIDANTWFFVLTTRKNFIQAIGRLTRSREDYGFFAVLSNGAIDKTLDKEHRQMLDIKKETPYTQIVADSAKSFFESVKR